MVIVVIVVETECRFNNLEDAIEQNSSSSFESVTNGLAKRTSFFSKAGSSISSPVLRKCSGGYPTNPGFPIGDPRKALKDTKRFYMQRDQYPADERIEVA